MLRLNGLVPRPETDLSLGGIVPRLSLGRQKVRLGKGKLRLERRTLRVGRGKLRLERGKLRLGVLRLGETVARLKTSEDWEKEKLRLERRKLRLGGANTGCDSPKT